MEIGAEVMKAKQFLYDNLAARVATNRLHRAGQHRPQPAKK